MLDGGYDTGGLLIGSLTSRACSETSGGGFSPVESLVQCAAADRRNQGNFVVVVQLGSCLSVFLVHGQRDRIAKALQPRDAPLEFGKQIAQPRSLRKFHRFVVESCDVAQHPEIEHTNLHGCKNNPGRDFPSLSPI